MWLSRPEKNSPTRDDSPVRSPLLLSRKDRTRPADATAAADAVGKAFPFEDSLRPMTWDQSGDMSVPVPPASSTYNSTTAGMNIGEDATLRTALIMRLSIYEEGSSGDMTNYMAR